MKIHPNPARIAMSTLVVTALLSACGQRGPLYLPPPPDTPRIAAEPAPAPASTPTASPSSSR